MNRKCAKYKWREVANDPLLYSPTWIETLGAIKRSRSILQRFTIRYSQTFDRCRHEGWYDKASQPRLFTNFYRLPSWPTGSRGYRLYSFLPVNWSTHATDPSLPSPFYPTQKSRRNTSLSPFLSLALSSIALNFILQFYPDSLIDLSQSPLY